MKTASVRVLRNYFSRVSPWVKPGRELTWPKRGKPLAASTPIPEPEAPKLRIFDPAEDEKRLRELEAGEVLAEKSVLIFRADDQR